MGRLRAFVPVFVFVGSPCGVQAAVSLACPGGLSDELPETFFKNLHGYQQRYSRDSIKVSRDFLYGVYQEKIVPDFQEYFKKCPVPLLEIMMNSILAADTDFSAREARLLYESAATAAAEASHLPEVAELIKEWKDDTAHVYPFLFGLRPGDCYNTNLKFYVYETPGNLTRPLLGCVSGQWGTEVLFHRYLANAPCRTYDPDEADFFFVPIYGTCLFVKREMENDQMAREQLWNHLIDFLWQQPAWARRGGADHIFLFADGQSARIWDSYDLVRGNSILLMVEAKCPTWDEPMRSYTDVKSCHSPWKDIIIPGHTDHARARYMLAHNMRTEERDILMTFHGRHPGIHDAYTGCEVRGKVMSLDGLPGVDVGGFVSDYLERKGRSHFCLVPGGTSPWTNHLYESFFCGCIPVILSDEYEVAFQDHVDWTRFSIKWPESQVGQRLYDYLVSFTPLALKQMKAEVDGHRCWFDYFSEDPQCSPFRAVLKNLEERKQRFPQRQARFWNSKAAFELKDGEEKEGVNVPNGAKDPRWLTPRVTRFHSLTNETFSLPW